MGRADRLTEVLKCYDPKLYCEKNREGKLCVFRKSKRVETYDIDGCAVHFVRPAPHFIFALTDSWRADGNSIDWGIEPIMNKVRQGDLWNRDLAEDLIRAREKKYEKDQRHLHNESEAFLKDWRRGFAKQFGDVNTSTLKKTDSRYLGDKRHGSK